MSYSNPMPLRRIAALSCAAAINVTVLAGCAAEPDIVEEVTESLKHPGGSHDGTRCATPEARATGASTIESVITTTGVDQYRADQVGVVDETVHNVWAELGRLDEFFRVSLPAAENIHWIKGDGASVGDELTFILNGAPIVLAVVERNQHTHRFRYDFMQSALGIADIQSDLQITNRCGHADIHWIRDFRMEPGVSFDALRDIATQEFAGLIAHYE